VWLATAAQSAGPAAVLHVSRGRQECVRSCYAQGLLQRGARALSCTRRARASWKRIWNLGALGISRGAELTRAGPRAPHLSISMSSCFSMLRASMSMVLNANQTGCLSPNAAGADAPNARRRWSQQAGTAGTRPFRSFSCADCAGSTRCWLGRAWTWPSTMRRFSGASAATVLPRGLTPAERGCRPRIATHPQKAPRMTLPSLLLSSRHTSPPRSPCSLGKKTLIAPALRLHYCRRPLFIDLTLLSLLHFTEEFFFRSSASTFTSDEQFQYLTQANLGR